MSKKKPKPASNLIVQNRKARHDYFLENNLEAGIVLAGWEVKSLRAGKVQLVDSYVYFKNGEAWLWGAIITPLPTVSTHFVAEPQRELAKLMIGVEQKGYTCVCTRLYWKNHLIKAEIALAKGKAEHDKRHAEQDRDWDREKQRIFRHQTKPTHRKALEE